MSAAAAEAVLARYHIPGARLTSLGSAGGFSGARIWRVESPGEAWCLKSWPSESPTAERLGRIHMWMVEARGAALDFVPLVLHARDGSTVQECAGRLWDVTLWMPGQADFHVSPTNDKLAAAIEALARLHVVWGREQVSAAPCPAVRRRLDALADWDEALRSGWQPPFDGTALGAVAERAWRCLPARVAALPRLLDPLRDAPFRLHPCLCDVWHDHILFDGNRVSGVIDYGGMRIDSPAADLARLLGSLVPDDAGLIAAALNEYQRHTRLTPAEIALISALDLSGVALSAARWLARLYRDGHRPDDPVAVAGRLGALVGRLERGTGIMP